MLLQIGIAALPLGLSRNWGIILITTCGTFLHSSQVCCRSGRKKSGRVGLNQMTAASSPMQRCSACHSDSRKWPRTPSRRPSGWPEQPRHIHKLLDQNCCSMLRINIWACGRSMRDDFFPTTFLPAEIERWQELREGFTSRADVSSWLSFLCCSIIKLNLLCFQPD